MDKSGQIAREIQIAEQTLHREYEHAYSVNHELDRTIVSYQRSKTESVSRWCKFKEAFSTSFVRYILDRLSIGQGSVLDPFAGSGTAIFTSAALGMDSIGVELLPNAYAIMELRKSVSDMDSTQVTKAINQFAEALSWESAGPTVPFSHLTITKGAFPPDNEVLLGRYRYETAKVVDPEIRRLLEFAAMCVLEDISYTSKDGQYLRWDGRVSNGRSRQTAFRKRSVLNFTSAIISKLREMSDDIFSSLLPTELRFETYHPGSISLLSGSALDILPSVESSSVDALLTSPPYCNRYDYTRTYALELAWLGIGDDELKLLRQAMLSCTVENKDKTNLYANVHVGFNRAIEAFENQALLQSIILFLESCSQEKTLNNSGILRLVTNYFKEMALVIFECSRILKSGSPMIMVNDNVRYQGMHIAVDLILADMATKAGFDIEHIWSLPVGKGSSSQQSASHGRAHIRKCVYVWRKKRTSTSTSNACEERAE